MTSAQQNNGNGIQFFRADDGEPLSESQMPMEGMNDSIMKGFAKIADTGIDATSGDTVRCLFSSPDKNGPSLIHAWFKSGFLLPRHSHSADCVYYIIAGELRIGSKTLNKGDGFFVPKDCPYSYEVGPQGLEILEFRNASQFNIVFKNNDEKHWDRVAASYRDNGPNWPDETTPPSERAIS